MAALYRKYRMKEENIKTKEDYFKVMQDAFSLTHKVCSFEDPKDVYLVFTEETQLFQVKSRDLERAFALLAK